MWAAPKVLLSCGLWHPTSAAASSGDQNRRNPSPFIVSAKYFREKQPRKNISFDYAVDDDYDEEVDTLKQQAIRARGLDDTEVAGRESPQVEEKGERRQSISGSAVLLALQKATAQKAKNKNKKKTMMATSGKKNVRRNGNGNGEDVVDYSNVTPLCIKSDWNSRLDELEKQLQDLIHS